MFARAVGLGSGRKKFEKRRKKAVGDEKQRHLCVRVCVGCVLVLVCVVSRSLLSASEKIMWPTARAKGSMTTIHCIPILYIIQASQTDKYS